MQPLPDQLEHSEGNQKIYFIRHGESTSNVVDPETGLYLTSGRSLNIALTENGKQQAARLGAELAQKISVDTKVVISFSTALRAQQTALEIFNQLQEAGFACELDTNYDGLCELGQGSWEGLPKDEAYQAEVKKWEQLSAYDKFSFPRVNSGESSKDVVARFFPAVQTIIQKHPNKLNLVVSHCAALNAAMLHLNMHKEDLSKNPQSMLPYIPLENCDLIAVELPANGSFQAAKAVVHYRLP